MPLSASEACWDGLFYLFCVKDLIRLWEAHFSLPFRMLTCKNVLDQIWGSHFQWGKTSNLGKHPTKSIWLTECLWIYVCIYSVWVVHLLFIRVMYQCSTVNAVILVSSKAFPHLNHACPTLSLSVKSGRDNWLSLHMHTSTCTLRHTTAYTHTHTEAT